MRPVTLFMFSLILILLVWTCVKDAEAQKKRCTFSELTAYSGTLCGKTGVSDYCIMKSKRVPKPFRCFCGNSLDYSMVTGKTVSEFLRTSKKYHHCECTYFCKS
ncbi:hypothetical protein YC2023_055541 [Brassica napus]